MIKLIKSTFYNETKTKKALNDFILDAEILSFGKECEKFEMNFARWQGRKYCVFMNSGSSANLAMIQSMLNLGKLKKGDSVGFSAITWATNVMPLMQLGLNPMPIDVELDTLNISSNKLKEALKKRRIKMLFITNLLGFCDDLDEIVKICKEEDVVLLEDNCESLGSEYKGKLLGNFGLASSISFYVGHHMSTIEGGAVCTDSERLAAMLRMVRAHGWDRNLSQKKQADMRLKYKVNSTFYSRYTFYDLGYNFRPTEINGFIGNTQIPYLKETILQRNKNFMKLAKAIYTNTDKYYPLKYDHMDFLSNFAVPVICKSRKIRDELVEKCNNKVEIRPIVGGDMTKQPFFKKYIKIAFENSNARLLHEQGFYFGNNPDMTNQEIEQLIKIFSNEK